VSAIYGSIWELSKNWRGVWEKVSVRKKKVTRDAGRMQILENKCDCLVQILLLLLIKKKDRNASLKVHLCTSLSLSEYMKLGNRYVEYVYIQS